MTSKHAKLIQTTGKICDWSCSLETDNERRNEKANVKRHQKAEEKRVRRKKSSTLPSFNLIFPMCCRDCHSRIGLHSHTRSCRTTIDWLGRTYLVSRDFTCQLARSSQGGGGGGGATSRIDQGFQCCVLLNLKNECFALQRKKRSKNSFCI